VSIQEQTTEYPKSHITDANISIAKQEVKIVSPPERILIVSPTANGCDLILDKLKPLSKQYKILRIGTSKLRPDLNKKYGLNITEK